MLHRVAIGVAVVVAGAAGSALGSPLANAQGGYSGFYEARVLEPAAAFVAGKPVKVWCAKSQAVWDSYAEGRVTHGLTTGGSSLTHLDVVTCFNARARLLGGPIFNAGLAPAIELLTHEAIHMRGERDEGVTDCAAVHEMPGVAVRFFGLKSGKQLRDLMSAAWAWRARLAPEYRTVC